MQKWYTSDRAGLSEKLSKGIRRRLLAILVCLTMVFSLAACGQGSESPQGDGAEAQSDTVSGAAADEGADTQEDADDSQENTIGDTLKMYEVNRQLSENRPADKYRTCYEVFVYSFYDSDGDGIGDLKGLTEKLDYINDGDATTHEDLGCDAIWLMPVMPSPTYHKYDVTDYCGIDPAYGSMSDFEALVSACHERGVNVYIDFVMNHTSSEHEWFTTAADYLRSLKKGEKPSAKKCKYFDYYNFNKDGGSGYAELEGTDWYYEAQFWSGMPDLNLSSKKVRGELEKVVDFWLDKGVDGFRLDATTYYDGVGSKENIEILKWFSDYVYGKNPDAYIVGEAWTDLTTYASMYEGGIDSFFAFSFADKDGTISSTVNGRTQSGASSYGLALKSVDETIRQYTDEYIDAPFLSNHDTGRAAGFFSGDDADAMIKMAWTLNLFQGGTAFLYYGEELGMKGSGKDENKRLGMLWSSDLGTTGMCAGPADAENVKMKYGSLEEQQGDPLSIYCYMREAIGLRNAYPAIARGNNIFHDELSDENICIIEKSYGGDSVLLIFNISNEEKNVDISSLKLEEKNVSDLELGGMLQTSESAPTYESGTATLPAYSTLILK